MSLKSIAHGLHDVRLVKEQQAKIAAEVAAAAEPARKVVTCQASDLRRALVDAVAAAPSSAVIYNALAQWCEQQSDHIADLDEPPAVLIEELAGVQAVVEAYELALHGTARR